MRARNPLGMTVASALSTLVGAGFLVLAGFSLASGHGLFSWQIASILAGYGLLMGLAAWGLWRRIGFARGPVVAFALLNGLVATQYLSQPGGWLVLIASAATVVSAVLPSTTEVLLRRRSLS